MAGEMELRKGRSQAAMRPKGYGGLLQESLP